MPSFNVSISGSKVQPEIDGKDKFDSEEDIEAANISDAIYRSVSNAGLDGFAAGDFTITLTEGAQ